MKTIIISSNTSWSICNFRLNLIRTLKEKGYKVVIVAPYDKYADLLKEEFEYHDIFINPKGTNPIEDLKTLWQYYRVYKRIKPQLAFHYTIKPNIYGTLAAKLNNTVSIAVTTGLGYAFINENIVSKIVKMMYKFSLKYAYQVWFLNRDDENIFIKNNIINKEKSFVLPGEGIDTTKFEPIKIEKKDNTFRFLLIARMLWDKGIGEYVEAAKIVKQKYTNVEFLLLGPTGVDNPTAISKEQIQKWVDEGIVKYLGVTDDVRNEIAKADCIVLPSYREGTSRVLLESAAMTKPIITTNVPGCKEVVDDGVNGYLCKVKNAKDLADKMRKMINLSEEERIKMGKAGREKVINEFDEKIVINKYLRTIEEFFEKEVK